MTDFKSFNKIPDHNTQNVMELIERHIDSDANSIPSLTTNNHNSDYKNHSITIPSIPSFDTNKPLILSIPSILSTPSILSILSTKDKLLLYFNEERTITEAVKKSKIWGDADITQGIKNAMNLIDYPSRGTGLLNLGFIEITKVDPTQYKITKLGEEHLLDYVRQYNEKIIREEACLEKLENVKQQIAAAKTFLEKHTDINTNKPYLEIDFSKLAKFHSELATKTLENPEELIKVFGVASDDITNNPKDIYFIKIPKTEFIKVGEKRTQDMGKLIAIQGSIKQRSPVMPRITSARFECPTCATIIPVLQVDKQFHEPSKCSCGRKGKFKLISKETINFQTLKLEELPEQLQGRTQAESVTVFLTKSLCSHERQTDYNPGSRITIIGILKDDYTATHSGRSGKNTLGSYYIDALGVESNEQKLSLVIVESEKKQIAKLSEDKVCIKKLIEAIEPKLYNRDLEKEAAILCLVGGGNSDRSDIHMLIVGDPGTGKSVLQKSISKKIPYCRYTNGISSSTVGLTGAAVWDEVTQNFVLEAGALVLANGGVVCLDELDKFKPEEKNSLNEALEQQTCTIHKCGVHGELQAKTGVIAAGNPKNMRFTGFNNYLSEVDLPAPLISRFDLIIIRRVETKEILEYAGHTVKVPELPDNLLIKYLFTCRQHKPTMTDLGKIRIKKILESIVGLKTVSDFPIQLDYRNLNALQRISTAYAKLELSNEVTPCHVDKAWEIYAKCLQSMGCSAFEVIEEKMGDDK